MWTQKQQVRLDKIAAVIYHPTLTVSLYLPDLWDSYLNNFIFPPSKLKIALWKKCTLFLVPGLLFLARLPPQEALQK